MLMRTGLIALAAGCAQLPDAGLHMGARGAPQVEIEGARGALSTQRVAAVLSKLSRDAGELDILQQHVAVEQAIVGSPLTAGNRVLLLQDGAPTYRAMFAAIGAATDHINLETYKIEDDEIGRQFSELLLQKRSQGVRVNLLYDSVGSIGTPKAFFDRLTAGGVQVLEFNPANPLSAKKEWLVNNRDHRKLLVIDGHTAFVGGINFSRVHSGGSFARREGPEAKAAWRDTHLRIEGPVVDEFQSCSCRRGRSSAARRSPPRTTFPRSPARAAKWCARSAARPRTRTASST